ncbi:MAG: ECF transporter S component [Synergistaceae bacterium]|nr:ECF transporter S component [Synergistaceae bacterium]
MSTRTAITSLGVRGITTTALLSAAAAILMFLDFAVPIFPTFLKMDLSDVPALMAAFAIGPGAAIAVEFIKNAVNIAYTHTGGIGELANFLIGISFAVPAGIIYKRRRTRGGACIGMASGVIAMSVVAAVANYLVLVPLYSRIIPLDTMINAYMAINPYANTLGKVILMSIVPFNLCKGVVVSLITFALYKRISPIVKG